MAVIRKIDIRNFRSIKTLTWHPSAGFNCLIGPGDVGKTTIIDAIDLCLGARRNAIFTDADFYHLEVEQPIQISLVLGSLEDSLKNIDSYGEYLCGYNPENGTIEDEPANGIETVLCLLLQVEQDLEPVWVLQSKRAEAKGLERNLKWADRERIAPLRLGSTADTNLAWRRGSILNKLSDETPDASSVLTSAARDARSGFGEDAAEQLKDAIKIVNDTAKGHGVNVGATATAMLDIHTVSFGSGSIALHNDKGIPLKNMGTGSKRLLIAGMQRSTTQINSITLIDEIETGIPPVWWTPSN